MLTDFKIVNQKIGMAHFGDVTITFFQNKKSSYFLQYYFS